MNQTMTQFHLLALLFCQLFLTLLCSCNALPGKWQLLQQSIGISAMHMQLLHNDRVIMFDRTDFGRSNISLPDGKCRDNDYAVKPRDCTAHSVEYDVASNTVRPLMVWTDIWCSSGSVIANGSLIQTGGFLNGSHRVRIVSACNTCDWIEVDNGLIRKRWYATNHILPNGHQIIIGGRAEFNYEFYPKTPGADKFYTLPFLLETYDKIIENNLYPFVFLIPDGNLFVFSNNRAILFDYVHKKVVKRYPTIPGGDPRNYPSTGSAVLLPLRNLSSTRIEVEVLICGGAPIGSFKQARKGIFVKALNNCGRIKISDSNPQWVMEIMPMSRVMGDMTLLPNGNVLIINGAGSGTAGWEFGRDPILNPVVYRPENPSGSKFEVQAPTTIPRMYHSSAILLRDGRVLVGGSNPHIYYNFSNVLFATDLRLEAFSPAYLEAKFAKLRPIIIQPHSIPMFKYGQDVYVKFVVYGALNPKSVEVTLVAPSFATHSFSQNQRLLILDGGRVTWVAGSVYHAHIKMPRSANLAPAGYYLLFVVHQDIPSEGSWIHID